MMAPRHSADLWPASPGILFADDFDDDTPALADGAAAAMAIPAEPAFSAADLDSARREGHEQGRQAALAEIAAQHSIAASAALGHIGQLLAQSGEDAAAAIEQSSEAISRLLFEIVASMLPSLRARHDPAEIAGMVHDLMIGMTPETAVCLSVAPELADGVRAALTGLPAELARRVAIEPCQGMTPGDARLTWDSGSATRSGRRVQQAVNEILVRLDLLPPPPQTQPQTQTQTQPRPTFVPATPIMTAVEGEKSDA